MSWIAQAGSEATTTASGAAAVLHKQSTRERVAWSAAGGLLLASIAFGVAYYKSAHQEVRVTRAFIPTPEKHSFYFMSAPDAAPPEVSPDGKRVVFGTWGPDGTRALWVRELDSLTARPLAGTEGGGYPFWSPDSRAVAFFSQGKLKRVDAAGGPAVSLCDAPSGRGGTWNHDGIIVFGPDASSVLHRVAATGGASTPVTQFDQARGETTHRWPRFLPDGKHFLYLGRSGSAGVEREESGIRIGSLDGTPGTLLLRGLSNALFASGHLLFVREGALMAQPFDPGALALQKEAFPLGEQIQYDASFGRGTFSASENGVLVFQTGEGQIGSQLLWYDRSGKQLGQLGEPIVTSDLSISPDQQRVAVALTDPRIPGPPDIWIYDLARAGLRTRFTFSPRVDWRPVWSPDSTRLAFTSARAGRQNLYVKSLAGTGEEEPLIQSDNDKFVRSWSSDGRYIAYDVRGVPKTNADIWVLPLTGDKKPFPFLQTEFRESLPTFSPDMKWMAYASDESGREEVYVTPFPIAGRKSQVSTGGGTFPLWRGDGKEIFYVTQDNKLIAAEVSARGDTFQVGTVKPLFEARMRRPGTIYDVTRDGKRFLVNTLPAQQSSPPFVLVVNWTAELKK